MTFRNLWHQRHLASREELAELLPAPGDPVLPGDRRLLLEEHLMSQIAPEGRPGASPGETGPGTSDDAESPALLPARRHRRRAALIAAPLAVALAAGAAVAVQSAGGADGGETAPPTAQPRLTLAGAIDHIARTATAQDVPVPRADQYLYIESLVSFQSDEFNLDTGEMTSEIEDLHRRETWFSPDGTEGWLIEPDQEGLGGHLGVQLSGAQRNALTSPSYDFLTTLPTDPRELLEMIYEDGEGEGDTREERAFSTIGSLLRGQLLPPGLGAALYEAAGMIPGVELVEGVADASGREGIAVALESETYGERTEWIFDADTYEYLGERVVQTEQQNANDPEPGTVIGYTAVVERAVVDELRQRPDAVVEEHQRSDPAP